MFLYYRPQQLNPITLADLQAWGLGYAFPCDPEFTICQGGTPDGATGTLFRDGARAGETSLAMNLDQQTWAPCAATGCYVGYWNDHKPGPADLARARQLPGYDVALGDGNYWKVPLVRRFDQGTKLLENALPTKKVCGLDGKWAKGDVLAAHAELWELTKPFAEGYAALATGATPPEFTEQQLCDAAVALLQKNYAVGAGELSLLGAFNDEVGVHPVLIWACDAKTFADWSAQKKTDS